MLTELKRRGECQWRREKGHSKKPPKLKEHPKVSVLIPARRRRDRQPARPQSHDAARKNPDRRIRERHQPHQADAAPRRQAHDGLWRRRGLAEFAISVLLDMRYGEDLWKVIFWVIWYPVVYWAFNAMAAAVSFLKGFFRSMQQPATWVSPDRGGR